MLYLGFKSSLCCRESSNPLINPIHTAVALSYVGIRSSGAAVRSQTCGPRGGLRDLLTWGEASDGRRSGDTAETLQRKHLCEHFNVSLLLAIVAQNRRLHESRVRKQQWQNSNINIKKRLVLGQGETLARCPSSACGRLETIPTVQLKSSSRQRGAAFREELSKHKHTGGHAELRREADCEGRQVCVQVWAQPRSPRSN